MSLEIACPSCGEEDNLKGTNADGRIHVECLSCGVAWTRGLAPKCETCGSEDLQTVPLAIVERSRGTQLSVVGTRPVTLCSVCDADTLTNYHANRPNPLMPRELPTVGEEQMKGRD
jgi:Zn ribbon nucleic-acid-binding protein